MRQMPTRNALCVSTHKAKLDLSAVRVTRIVADFRYAPLADARTCGSAQTATDPKEIMMTL